MKMWAGQAVVSAGGLSSATGGDTGGQTGPATAGRMTGSAVTADPRDGATLES